MARMVKTLPAMRETWFPSSLGREDPLEKRMEDVLLHNKIINM